MLYAVINTARPCDLSDSCMTQSNITEGVRPFDVRKNLIIECHYQGNIAIKILPKYLEA